jgi:hypothetical protein
MAARTISSSWKPASAFSRQRVDHRFLGPSGVTGFSSMPDKDEMSCNIEIVVRGNGLDTRSGSVTAPPWTAAARLHPGPKYLIACNHGSAVGRQILPHWLPGPKKAPEDWRPQHDVEHPVSPISNSIRSSGGGSCISPDHAVGSSTVGCSAPRREDGQQPAV